MPPTTARKIIKRGAPDVKTRGGPRVVCTKCTLEMRDVRVDYVEENDLYAVTQCRRCFFSTSKFK
ncbi:hypothetical protein JG687_00011238 [Phytophthora cactorum]|uniref:Uncharacterized protein n=1 Tax=Phytophthora cactorum TaxID=29920 RepID=A0A8T1UA84_9STRA|nr:hypothetical protein JG687_00011238 [Phytophthora cactorum]